MLALLFARCPVEFCFELSRPDDFFLYKLGLVLHGSFLTEFNPELGLMPAQ